MLVQVFLTVTNLENGLRGMTIPLHPALEKYYKEKGILK